MSRLTARLFLVALMLLSGGCMGPPPEPDGPGLSFLRGRERWRATDVEASVRDARRDGETTTGSEGSADAATELALTIQARDGATGEMVTFLVVLPELAGTHPLRVFGSFAAFDTDKGYERLQGITNACSPNDRSLTTGTLTIEEHDPAARTLRGSFIANVCLVENPEETWTLGDGKFQELSY